ncbi:hypothetical protein H4R34_002812 [Dimargaris verticillata]|uniref:Uncharacterized protein n=1 Tax=Dimargaris verticillata TaxID=2761393 RepID=A0A9W8E9M9_9FUNG|nr:hypothetical protein H4R34_002812 [Dimargaris verticillata]
MTKGKGKPKSQLPRADPGFWLKATTPSAPRTTLADQADAYVLYRESVQAPRKEVRTLANIYRDMYDRYEGPILKAAQTKPNEYASRLQPDAADELAALDLSERVPRRASTLREDFCGTAALCQEWVQAHVNNTAIGVDIDPQVIQYAQTHTLADAGIAAQVRLVLGNVLTIDAALSRLSAQDATTQDCTIHSGQHQPSPLPKAHVIASLNYALFYFHERQKLVQYLRVSYANLNSFGILVADAFGGTRLFNDLPRTKTRSMGTYTYHFEYRSFDALTNLGRYAIHFEFCDGSWIRNHFTYTFRIYSLAELREAMLEAGFYRVHIWVAGAQASTSPQDAHPGTQRHQGPPRTRKHSGHEKQGPTNSSSRRRPPSHLYQANDTESDQSRVTSSDPDDLASDDDDTREYEEVGCQPLPAAEHFNGGYYQG